MTAPLAVDVTVKVTGTPEIGADRSSTICTTNGEPSAVPTAPDWGLPGYWGSLELDGSPETSDMVPEFTRNTTGAMPSARASTAA